MQIFDNVQPAIAEPCTTTEAEFRRTIIEPPANLVEGSEARLAEALRRKADFSNPINTLAQSAFHFLQSRGVLPGRDALTDAHARALADLTVTGRRSYDRITRQLTPSNDVNLVTNALRELIRARGLAVPSDTALRPGVSDALNRAYSVAWALRGSGAGRADLRARLGWIAVSAEDDPPHRPVNVPTASYPQYDLRVTVSGQVMDLRYMVALAEDSSTFPASPTGFPPDQLPVIPPNHDIILFIHGHSSRLEEGMSIVPVLIQKGRERGQNFAVIALDLPCNGYSTMFDHTAIAPVSESRYNPTDPDGCRFPILEFIENAIVQFIETLDNRLQTTGNPTIRHRVEAIIGGSLGGNLTLRLSRRSDVTWIKRLVSWSPASVWESWGRATSNPFDALPGRGRYVDVIKDIVFNRTKDRMDDAESSGSREEHIQRTFVGEELINGWDWTRWISSQSDKWYRPDWTPCNRFAAEGGRRFIREIYNQHFRRWHWRVAHEQLGFSHRDQVGRGQPRSFELMRKPLLLLAGALDNDDKLRIFDETKRLARDIPTNSGRGIFLLDTGHSIHSERPQLLTQEILSFIPVRLATVSRAKAWVWADLPTIANYTPSTSYQYNSAGGTNQITRLSTGQYQVDLPWLGASGGTVHVSAYGGNHYCKMVGWGAVSGKQRIRVNCFSPEGNPIDGRFVLLFYKESRGVTWTNAYLWADQPTAESYTPSPAYQWNSKGLSNTIRRVQTGYYQVTLPGLNVLGGTVLVSAYGNGTERCKVGGWYLSGNNTIVDVYGFDVAGNPVDTRFTLSFLTDVGLGIESNEQQHYGGYVWADQPSASIYTPDRTYQLNTTGGVNTIARASLGSYKVNFPSLAPSNSTAALITAYGMGSEYCTVQGWESDGSGGTNVTVQCFSSSGTPTETRFTLVYLTDDPIPF